LILRVAFSPPEPSSPPQSGVVALPETQDLADAERRLVGPAVLRLAFERAANEDGAGAAHGDRIPVQKATERSRVVGLYRRGRLTDTDLDAQMDEDCWHPLAPPTGSRSPVSPATISFPLFRTFIIV